MRRHCEQQHPYHQLPDERIAQWDWGPEELIVLGEGQGAFWDNKRKSWWAHTERKQKRKKNAHCNLRCPPGRQGGGGGDRPCAARAAGLGGRF